MTGAASEGGVVVKYFPPPGERHFYHWGCFFATKNVHAASAIAWEPNERSQPSIASSIPTVWEGWHHREAGRRVDSWAYDLWKMIEAENLNNANPARGGGG